MADPGCTMSRRDAVSRYKTNRRITYLVSDMNRHLKLSPFALIPGLPEEQTHVFPEGFGQIMKESENVPGMASSSSSSANTSQSLASTGFFVKEPLGVGQQKAFARVEKVVIDLGLSRIGIVGMGGSGKTLMFKTLFNSEMARNVFRCGLLLWLTVSQSPSFTVIENGLRG